MKKMAVMVCLALFAACSNENSVKTGKSKAYIFERRGLPGNKLLLSYIYKIGHRPMQDSCVIDSRVIVQDSMDIDVLAKKSTTAYSYRQ